MDFDKLKDNLLAIAETGLKYAKQKGANQSEIFVSNQNSINVRNQSGMIDAIDGNNSGIGIHIAIGKRLGFAAISGLAINSLKQAIDEAISIAKSVKEENVGFESFPTKQKQAKDGLLDTKILSLTTEDIVNKTNQIFLDAKNYDKRLASISATTQAQYGGYAVANSEGLIGASRYTTYTNVVFLTASENQQRKSAFDYSVTRNVTEEADLGSRCAEKAIKLLGSKPLKHTGILPTVWNPIVMSGFWNTALTNSINGRQVVEKNSYFMDKLGDKVGINSLKIVDDGQLPEGLGTSAIDMEGCPQQTTTIIDNGVLKSFLYDNYYGRLAKSKSTGNATRAQVYENSPVIAPTTIVIQPGTKSFSDIVSEIDKGIYVMDFVMGMGHSNLISGDFSIVATSSYLIEKGEIANPLDSITIAGNLYKSFKDIMNIGTDSRLLPGVKTPSVAFDGFTVVG